MKLLISTPVYNQQLMSPMVSSVLKVIQECWKRNVAVDWDRPSSCILAHNRNVSAQKALDESYDWLLFWDADTEVDSVDFVFQMIEVAYKENTRVVALPCRLKHPEVKKWNCAFRQLDGQYLNLDGGLPTEPFAIDMIGTGVFLIKVALLEEFQRPWFQQVCTKTGFFPEDWTFCEALQARKEKIIADPRFLVKHWGAYSYE